MLIVVIIVGLAAAAALGAVLVYGALSWAGAARRQLARVEAARIPVTPRVVDFGELDKLPPPVQRYFRTVLEEGRPMVSGVRVRHAGTIKMSEASSRWRPFTSEQRVITRRPGFIWEGRVRMTPGLTVRVHDAYVAGEGILRAALLGAVPPVNLAGAGAVAEGELMRFFAEAAWYPTVLLPSQGIRWEGIDAHSARAVLVDGSVVLMMTFRFDQQGLIETVRAESRGRTVGSRIIPTPWHGLFSNYQERGGMLVPSDGEVAWLLPEGMEPYWCRPIQDAAHGGPRRRNSGCAASRTERHEKKAPCLA
jgi:hypothetical protein